MKEYVIFENDNIQVWRIYKRIYKRGPTSPPYRTKFINLTFFKKHGCFSIQHQQFTERYTKSTPIYFDLKTLNGRLHSRNNTNAAISHVNLSKTSHAKVNRLLKPYFPTFKIGLDFGDNIKNFHFPEKFDCPDYMLYECRPFLTGVSTFKDVVYKACKYKGKGMIKKLITSTENCNGNVSYKDMPKRFRNLITMYYNKGFWGHGEINDYLSTNGCVIYNRAAYRKILRNKECLKKPELLVNSGYNVVDSIRLYKTLLETDIDPNEYLQNTWVQTHNALSGVMHRARTRKVEYKEWLPQIDDEWVLRTPTDSHELVDWGRDTRNCVGSYTHEHETGSCIIVGAFKNNHLEMVMSLNKEGKNSYTLEEIKENCNRLPPQEVTDRIVEIFNRNKIKVVDNDPRETFGGI